MPYLDMLDDLISEGHTVKVESAGSAWKLTLNADKKNEVLILDESLEALIGWTYSNYYLKDSP